MTHPANVQRTIQKREQNGERRGMRKGMRKGMREGIARQRKRLCRQAAKKFDCDSTSMQLELLISNVDDPDVLAKVGENIIKYDSGWTFLSTSMKSGLLKRDLRYLTSVQRTARKCEREAERRGKQRGMAKGRRDQLCRLAAKKFNDHTSKQLKTLLKAVDDPNVLDQVAEDIIDCDSGKEFIKVCKGLGSLYG